jgi:aconitate hydratase
MYRIHAVDAAARLPYRLKVLLENLLRNEDGEVVTADYGAASPINPQVPVER